MAVVSRAPEPSGPSPYEVVFRSQPEEFSFTVDKITGSLPRALRGTFLRNGPGLQQIGPDPLNYYDGLAMISGIGFQDGRAYLRSRHVRTCLYEEETRAGRQRRRRILTNLPGWRSNVGRIAFGDPAAHAVYAWGGRIFATGDQGHWALDARTFDTLGVERWGAGKGHQT